MPTTERLGLGSDVNWDLEMMSAIKFLLHGDLVMRERCSLLGGFTRMVFGNGSGKVA